jgi:hypothetical protein
MKIRTITVTLAATFALCALAGCGDDSNNAPRPQGTTEATAATEPTPDPDKDEAIARAAQFRLEDFPSGWQQSDEEPESEGADCDAIQDARNDVNARASSPSFAEGENTEAASTVYIFADAAQAQNAFDELSSQETRECVGDEFADTVKEATKSPAGAFDPDAVTVGEPATGRIQVDSVGDYSDAGRVTLPLSAEGIDVDYAVDLVFVRVDRGIALLVFGDVLTPFDEELRSDLTSKVTRRLAAEFG